MNARVLRVTVDAWTQQYLRFWGFRSVSHFLDAACGVVPWPTRGQRAHLWWLDEMERRRQRRQARRARERAPR